MKYEDNNGNKTIAQIAISDFLEEYPTLDKVETTIYGQTTIDDMKEYSSKTLKQSYSIDAEDFFEISKNKDEFDNSLKVANFSGYSSAN